MNLPFRIARRYLLAKKSHSAINTISWVSVCGVAVTTMALICALSVFNGFQFLIASLYSDLDATVRIEPARGKVLDESLPRLIELAEWKEVKEVAPVLEEYALAVYRNRQTPVRVKGVPENYARVTSIDSTLLDGSFRLTDSVADYATVGVGVANRLSLGAQSLYPISLYAPRRGEKINPANPMAAFSGKRLFATAVFSVSQPEYDDQLLYVPLSFARSLLGYERGATALEIRLWPGVDEETVVERIRQAVGDDFRVLTRMQQQEASFKIMEIEKWITFLILGFILMIASFNVVGSLSMLMLEKQADSKTLMCLGADRNFVSRIFLFEGWLIALVGAGGGLVVGMGLVLLQQHFGLLRLGGEAGTFLIDAYPVKLLGSDVLATFLLVAFLGFLAAWFPVYDFRRRMSLKTEE